MVGVEPAIVEKILNYINMKKIFYLIVLLLLSNMVIAEEKVHYAYAYRQHSFAESTKHLGTLYLLNWGGYYLSQPEEFSHHGSFKEYRKRFGKVVFDMDSTNWNQIVHPYVGSQVYLYYRAFNYSRMESFFMTFIQSALFEFTIENYTEPASAQDLYQTPVLGSILGILLEEGSLKLLNSESSTARFFGHLINPMTLFPFFEGKSQLTPLTSENKIIGLNLRVEIP